MKKLTASEKELLVEFLKDTMLDRAIKETILNGFITWPIDMKKVLADYGIEGEI